MTIAAIAQLLIALGFLSIPLIRHRYGPAARAAAEAELVRQDIPVTVLADNRIRFDASGHETLVPATVAAIMVTLAGLNLADSGLGRVLTWVFGSLVLVGNALILRSQLTAAKSVSAAFARKGDPVLSRVDVSALLGAAESAFPTWVIPGLQNVRHTVVFAGSILALVATIIA